MKKIRVGINGLGRIGRTLLREYVDRNISDFQIVAVNNPGDSARYAHLIQFDSVHGRFQHKVELSGGTLRLGEHKLNIYTESNPTLIPWEKDQVDVVIDATGVFKDKEGLGQHMRGTVKKVVMCAPGSKLDGTFVMGINSDSYDHGKHHIISNASCTTNCLAPVAKVLEDNYGIESGFMTTIHSYTSDQRLLDAAHSDLRRARAAAMSMIPTSTGAAKALGQVIPSLAGKLDGYAVRVPTWDVSMVDLTVVLKKTASKEAINAVMKNAAETYLKGILSYTELELVSLDFRGDRSSSTFDSLLTNVIGNNVKVVAWYDNEIGFSNRVLDLVALVGSRF